MEIALDYDKKNPEASLGAALIAFQGALDLSLSALAAEKGVEDMSWFDELHQNAVRAAKGTITEQIPIETEAGALRFGFQAVDALFQTIRVRLVEKTQ